MFRTYPLNGNRQPRPESLRQILSRLERELAEQPPRPRRNQEPVDRRTSLPF
jgi:hypothetical protein